MRHAAPSRRKPAVLLWTAAILSFLLISVAAALRADAGPLPGRATRTASWSASGNVKSVSIENVNGDVKVVAGNAVTASIEITAKARTDEAARKALDATQTFFENHDGNVELTVEPPGTHVRRSGRHGWNVSSDERHDVSVEARWTVTVPAGIVLDVSTVNGAVTSDGIAADLRLTSVNGKVTFSGARNEVKVNTVNGTVDGSIAELKSGSSVKADAVNGDITLRLPKGAGFRLSAHTMSGEILSTFAVPVAKAEAAALDEAARARDKARAERDKARAIREKVRVEQRHDEDGEEIDVDMTELNDAMAELNREMADLSRSITRDVMANFNRAYEATVGNGGASVKVSNLNGKILILEEGTKLADARTIVRSRAGRVITVPPDPPRAPRAVHAVPAVPPVPPASVVPPERIVVRIPKVPRIPAIHVNVDGEDEEEGSVVQGDVTGDFLTTLPMGDVKVGKVSGKVRISTRAGQIRVERAGKGCELKSLGGDVSIDSVTGDLDATTAGGNVEAGAVSGDARLDTQGGDVILKSCGGSVTAHTGGGDIDLKSVKGSVRAETNGGSILCALATAEPKSPSELTSHGGDVTLTLPANVHASLEVVVRDGDPDGRAIVSDFPEVAIERARGRESASGKLNGGGVRITVRSTSGTVTLRKGPAA